MTDRPKFDFTRRLMICFNGFERAQCRERERERWSIVAVAIIDGVAVVVVVVAIV